MKKIPLTNGGYTVVDDECYDALAGFKWARFRSGKAHYAARFVWQSGACKTILMHKELLPTADGRQVDHKNRDGLDNRLSNLRECTPSQNLANRVMPRKARPFRGVEARGSRFRACISVGGKKQSVGRFDTAEAAARAYDAAAKSIYGEFAVLNFH